MNTIKIIAIIIFLLFSCDERKLIYEEEYIPDLDENIPYEKLGNGKILFERSFEDFDKYDFLYLVDIDKRLCYPIKILESGYCYNFTLSPDGNKILFQKENNIFVMNNDGSKLKQITKSYGYFASVWNKNSNQIYFLQDNKLYSLNIDDTEDKKRYVTNFSYYNELGDFIGYLIPSEYLVSISSVEEIIFAVNYSDISSKDIYKGIYIIDSNHHKISLLYSSDLVDFFKPPKFSPVDDNKIAFQGIKVDTNGWIDSIYIFLLDRNINNVDILCKFDVNCTRLYSSYSMFSQCIDFSPDGDKIIFNINESDLESHLYVISISDSKVFKITDKKLAIDRNVSWGK